MKIYYGIDRKCLISHVENPLVSVRTLIKRKSPLVKNKDWFMDSGAFTYLKQYKEYPISIGKYLSVVDRFNPSLWTIQDWCCEPTIMRSTRLNVLNHIGNTIESGRQLIDFNDNVVMVVQGWTKEDYLICVDRIREQGLFTEVLGVGTICGRTDANEVFNILKSIKASIPDWCKIHAFGLSINLLKYKEIFDRVDSVDTNAYDFWRLDSKNETIINALLKYKEKVHRIVDLNNHQSLLEVIT